MPVVFVEEAPIAGRVVPAQGACVIGRDGCDVLLADPEASRRHARVLVVGGVPSVEDLGSRNGTFVNGARIAERTALRAGDRVQFGNTVWLVQEA